MLIHGFTYNAHPVSVAAGAAVLERIRSGELVQAADSESRRDREAVRQGRYENLGNMKNVGDVRGLGLLWGIEFVEDRTTKSPFPPEKKFSTLVASMA